MRPRSSDMLIVQFWSYGEVRVGKIDPTRGARINASYLNAGVFGRRAGSLTRELRPSLATRA